MNHQNTGQHGESRESVLKNVRTVLSFFALALVIVEALFIYALKVLEGTDRTILIVGMLLILALIIVIVAFLAYLRHEVLGNPSVISGTGPGPSIPKNKHIDIAGTYHAGIDYKYKVIINRVFGDYYRVFNPDDWEGVGFFDGEYYYGVFKMNDKATPVTRRGNWGSHRAKFLPNGSFDLFGIELKDKSEFDRFEGDGWNRESVGE